jgi:hypothetical protein
MEKEDLIQPAGAITAALIARTRSTVEISPQTVAQLFHKVLQALIDERPMRAS